VRRVERIAAARKVSPSELAISWVLAQGDDIVPIPGTKRQSYLEQNVRSAALTLTPDELRQIEEAAPKGVSAGARYADMSSVNR
jgi:aryl-alcohol dehydrogenase-like predicted oxidoreductase